MSAVAGASGIDLAALAELGIGPELIAARERLDGERALEFLAELPQLAAHWQQRLGCRDARMLPGGVLSAALACRDGSERRVLKLSARGATSARAEAAALRAWGGVGACRLRWASDDGRVMLLDAIDPGTPISPGEDAADARRAAALLRGLHGVQPFPAAVPDAAEELRWRFERARTHLDGPSHARGMISHEQIAAAHAATLALHGRRTETVLLHGDFIDKNLLLDSAGEWWAIDPRPCLGDPCLDAGFWALCHRPGVAVRPRCELIAETADLDPGRVWAWAQAFAVSEAVLVRDLPRARAYAGVAGGSTSEATR